MIYIYASSKCFLFKTCTHYIQGIYSLVHAIEHMTLVILVPSINLTKKKIKGHVLLCVVGFILKFSNAFLMSPSGGDALNNHPMTSELHDITHKRKESYQLEKSMVDTLIFYS